jgi:uncharacterized membrane protein
MSTPSETPSPAPEDRTVAILSYLTIIGFIVALVLHSTKKTALGSYHLRQTLGLIVTGLAIGIAGFVLAFIPILGWITILAAWIGFLVLWLMGLISAATGQQKPIPVLGEQFQKWFATAFG